MVTAARRGAGRRQAELPAKQTAGARPAAQQPALSAAGDIVAQLRSLLPSLAPAEQRVGAAIVAAPEQAAQLTITELAALAETSETTVVRFCRSVGVDSYPALRLMVATWAGRTRMLAQPRLSPEINPDDDLASMVARIGQALSTAVRETAERLDIDALDRAALAIAGARRVDIYGVGASGLVACDLQSKLHRIDLPAWSWTGLHMALTSAANLGGSDVVVAISHSGRTIDTLEPVALAKRGGAFVIAITNFVHSPLAEDADVALTTVSNEAAFRSAAMASRAAALTVVDSLFIAVAKRRWTDTTDAILRTNQALSARRKTHPRRR